MGKSNISTEKILFTADQAAVFGRQVRQFALKKKSRLLISNSHLTPPEATQAFIDEVADMNVYFYDWKHHNGDKDPYFAFLGFAHTIIVTGDSMSMQFEAASTGKPVYMALPQGDAYPEHWSVMDCLLKAGFVTKFNGEWQEWDVPPFPNYIQATADEIHNRLRQAQKSLPDRKTSKSQHIYPKLEK